MRVKTLEIVEVSQISEHVLLDSFEVRFWRNSMFKVSYYSLRKTGLGNFQVFFSPKYNTKSPKLKKVSDRTLKLITEFLKTNRFG